MDQIREDLDLLQASVVPDPDAASYQADVKSEHTSQTLWLPSGIEYRTRSDEASSRTSLIEHKEEMEESQEIRAPVAGTKRVTRPAACSNTLDGEERLPPSRPESVHDESEDAISADIERWLADAEAYSPLDFLYEMFSHLYVMEETAISFSKLTLFSLAVNVGKFWGLIRTIAKSCETRMT
jgi:hypothetical protein